MEAEAKVKGGKEVLRGGVGAVEAGLYAGAWAPVRRVLTILIPDQIDP